MEMVHTFLGLPLIQIFFHGVYSVLDKLTICFRKSLLRQKAENLNYIRNNPQRASSFLLLYQFPAASMSVVNAEIGCQRWFLSSVWVMQRNH